jgi:hypothetical protein
MQKVVDDASSPTGVNVSHVFHPESDALERKVRAIVRDEFERYGLRRDDAHERHNDFNWVRKKRTAEDVNRDEARKQINRNLINLFFKALAGAGALALAYLFGIKTGSR